MWRKSIDLSNVQHLIRPPCAFPRCDAPNDLPMQSDQRGRRRCREAHEYIKCKESTDHLSWNNAGIKQSVCPLLLPNPSHQTDINSLWQMESSLSFLNGSIHTTSHHVQVGVIGQFEIVNTCHDARQIVVRCVRRFAWLTNHSEHWCKSLEAYSWISRAWFGRDHNTYLQ